MDNIRDFLQNHINKALGLPPVHRLSSISCRPSKNLPSLSTDSEHEDVSNSESSHGLPENPKERILSGSETVQDLPKDSKEHTAGALTDSDETHVKQKIAELPTFTKGPVRFIVANDGSEDCIALLVKDTLIRQLRDLFQNSHDLDAKQGPLEYAQRQARNIELSMKDAQESLATAKDHEEANDLRAIIEQRESDLVRACKRRDKKEKKYRLVERNVASARDYTQYALETAMEEANLLGASIPPHEWTNSDVKNQDQSDDGSNNESDNESESFSRRGSDASANHDMDATESEMLCRAAREDLSQKSDLLQSFQYAYDAQGSQYGVDLANYEQGFENGTYNFSRSEFDRRKLECGQRLTRALIDAEADVEEAKVHARAIGAIGSSYGQLFDEEDTYEESFPENQIASYLAAKDWTFVNKWLENLYNADVMRCPDSRIEDDVEPVDIDEWDAGEVNIEDSVSAIDFDEYGKDIDYWGNECAKLREQTAKGVK